MNSSSPAVASSVSGALGIHRVVALLKLLAQHREQGLRFVQIAELAGLERPTAHRVLKALSKEGMVERDPTTKRYLLGPLIFELGLAAAPHFNLSELSAPSLQRLAQRTGDTAFLFIRRSMDAVCVSRIQGNYPIQTPVVPIGGRQPLGVNAGGLALLLGLEQDDAQEIIKANAPRLEAYEDLDADELLRSLQESRALGYAVIGEKAVPGVTAIGLPIYNPMKQPVAALTIAAITRRMTRARQAEIVPWLRQEVDEVERLLYR